MDLEHDWEWSFCSMDCWHSCWLKVRQEDQQEAPCNAICPFSSDTSSCLSSTNPRGLPTCSLHCMANSFNTSGKACTQCKAWLMSIGTSTRGAPRLIDPWAQHKAARYASCVQYACMLLSSRAGQQWSCSQASSGSAHFCAHHC